MTNRCPKCQRTGSLEASFKVWLDNVTIEKHNPHENQPFRYTLKDFDPSQVADGPAGIVVDEADGIYIRCKDCNHDITTKTNIPIHFADRWSYKP